MLWLFGNGTMLQPPGNNCGLWNTSYYIRWAGLNGCKRPVARVNVLNKNTTGTTIFYPAGPPPGRPPRTARMPCTWHAATWHGPADLPSYMKQISDQGDLGPPPSQNIFCTMDYDQIILNGAKLWSFN